MSLISVRGPEDFLEKFHFDKARSFFYWASLFPVNATLVFALHHYQVSHAGHEVLHAHS